MVEKKGRRFGLQYCEQRTLWRHTLAEGLPYILLVVRDVIIQ